ELRFLVQEPERAELQVLLESSASRWSPTWPAEGPRQPPCCLGGARLKLADLCLQGARESWIQLWADSSSSGSSGSSAEGHGQVRLLLHYQPFAHSEYELPQAHGLTGTSGSPDVGGGAKSCGTSQDDTIWDMQSAISASQEAAERRRVHLRKGIRQQAMLCWERLRQGSSFTGNSSSSHMNDADLDYHRSEEATEGSEHEARDAKAAQRMIIDGIGN
ncbi:hypothetical protein CYMTET_10119, partial [Cymbomonas tetramitiformis]